MSSTDTAASTGRRSRRSAGSEFSRQEGQQGPEALASGEQQMLGDLGQIGIVGGGRFEESFLHFGQSVPDVGQSNQIVQIGHQRCDHRTDIRDCR